MNKGIEPIELPHTKTAVDIVNYPQYSILCFSRTFQKHSNIPLSDFGLSRKRCEMHLDISHIKLQKKMIACSNHFKSLECKECIDWFFLITFTSVFDSNCQIERDFHHIRPDAADKFSSNWPSLVQKLLPRLLLEKDSKARKIISQLTDNLTIGTG